MINESHINIKEKNEKLIEFIENNLEIIKCKREKHNKTYKSMDRYDSQSEKEELYRIISFHSEKIEMIQNNLTVLNSSILKMEVSNKYFDLTQEAKSSSDAIHAFNQKVVDAKIN